MSKKANFDDRINTLSSNGGGDDTPFSGLGDDVWDALDSSDVGSVPTLSIFDVVADASQPRRVMPLNVRREWDGTAAGILPALMKWRDWVEGEINQKLDMAAILESVVEVEWDSERGAVQSFAALLNLASSILRDGLVNPIHVVKSESGHIIESGERRWMAYHLLNATYGDHERIAAHVQGEFSVWRQAAENTARRELGAIGMARQYARLLMALLEEDGQRFRPIGEMLNDRNGDQAFYAQVKDARIPYGKSGKVYDALGLSSRESVRLYKSLLGIDGALWLKADDENMSLNAILYEADIREKTPSKNELSNAFDNSTGAAEATPPMNRERHQPFTPTLPQTPTSGRDTSRPNASPPPNERGYTPSPAPNKGYSIARDDEGVGASLPPAPGLVDGDLRPISQDFTVDGYHVDTLLKNLAFLFDSFGDTASAKRLREVAEHTPYSVNEFIGDNGHDEWVAVLSMSFDGATASLERLWQMVGALYQHLLQMGGDDE